MARGVRILHLIRSQQYTHARKGLKCLQARTNRHQAEQRALPSRLQRFVHHIHLLSPLNTEFREHSRGSYNII